MLRCERLKCVSVQPSCTTPRHPSYAPILYPPPPHLNRYHLLPVLSSVHARTRSLNAASQCCRRFCPCCCKPPPREREEVNLLCVGMEGAGKSTLLALLAGESADNIQPTVGIAKFCLLSMVCLSLCLPVCLSVFPFVCLSFRLSVCLSVAVCLSPCLCPSVHLSVRHLSVYACVCLPACLHFFILHVAPRGSRAPTRDTVHYIITVHYHYTLSMQGLS